MNASTTMLLENGSAHEDNRFGNPGAIALEVVDTQGRVTAASQETRRDGAVEL
jgi:hypothetical protein